MVRPGRPLGADATGEKIPVSSADKAGTTASDPATRFEVVGEPIALVPVEESRELDRNLLAPPRPHLAEPAAVKTLCGLTTETMTVFGPYPGGLTEKCSDCKVLAQEAGSAYY